MIMKNKFDLTDGNFSGEIPTGGFVGDIPTGNYTGDTPVGGIADLPTDNFGKHTEEQLKGEN